MAGGIGHDELAPVRGEEPIGDVNGDALLALRRQAIDQEGEVDLSALGAHPSGVRLQGCKLVLEDHLGVIEQPPDQGRLAVIHRAAGQEAKEALGLMRLQVGVDVGGDQVGLMSHQK